jgi:hypothetical protein
MYAVGKGVVALSELLGAALWRLVYAQSLVFRLSSVGALAGAVAVLCRRCRGETGRRASVNNHC